MSSFVKPVWQYMLSFVLLIALGGMCVSCGPGKGKVRIKGHFREVDKADLILYSEYSGNAEVDTLHLDDGRFDVTLPAPDGKRVMTLLFPNFKEMYIVVEPGKTIDIEGKATDLAETNVDGTDDNELLTKLRLQNVNRPLSDQVMGAADFIRQNAATTAAEAVFIQYFAKKSTLTPQAGQLFDLLLRSQPGNAELQHLSTYIGSLLKNAEGNRLHAFSALDMNGHPVQLADYSGKVLLVYYFAQWYSDSHIVFSQIRAVKRAFGDRVGVVGISLDYAKESCRQLMASDTVPGRTVCDEKAFDSPLVSMLGMRYMPGFIVTDRTGRIVARDFPIDQLRSQVERALR